MDEARIRELLDFCERKAEELQATLEREHWPASFHDKTAYELVKRLRDRVAPVFPDVWQQIPRPALDYPSESYADALGYLELVAQRCRRVLEPTEAVSEESLTPQVRACLLITELKKKTGKLPTKKAIAEVLDVTPRTLWNWKPFRVVYAQAEASELGKPPTKGTKSAEGDLEAEN